MPMTGDEIRGKIRGFLAKFLRGDEVDDDDEDGGFRFQF